jgi:hypothetical protein
MMKTIQAHPSYPIRKEQSKNSPGVTAPALVAPATAKETAPRRSLGDLLGSLDRLVGVSANLVAKPVGDFQREGQIYSIPRYLFVGPTGGGAPIRIGIFAGLHGDEPEGSRAVVQFIRLLENRPELAQGYCLFFYPVCNPTGYEDGTRHSRSGRDLNREFWRDSNEPEVRLLQSELVSQAFDGLISLHSDDTSAGMYGFVSGATLTRHLLRPALAAAGDLLPVNQSEQIDGFNAAHGIIHGGYEGVLSAPPKVRPKPFEIILETPGQAPRYVQQCALVIALRTILTEYRKFIAYAANL